MIVTSLSTVKLFFTFKSSIFASLPPIWRVPPIDKSVTTTKFLFIVTVSSMNILLLAEISLVNTFEPTPPIIALWGIVSAG